MMFHLAGKQKTKEPFHMTHPEMYYHFGLSEIVG